MHSVFWSHVLKFYQYKTDIVAKMIRGLEEITMAQATFAVRKRQSMPSHAPVADSPPVDWVRFGQAVANARIDRRITRADLARNSGVSYSTLQRIEAGKQPDCPVPTLLRIATALGVNLHTLLAESVDTKNFLL
jgi:DNA-binding Xre family transcriptional regulator